MQKIRWFFLIMGIIVALVAAVQNNESTELQLFFFRRSLPLSIILVCTTAIGFLLGALTTVLMLRRNRSTAPAKPAEKPPAGPLPTEDR